MLKHVLPILYGLFGAVLFVSIHSFIYPKQNLGVVRLDELISQHIQTEGINQMTTGSLDLQARRYSIALDESVSEISIENNVFLIVSPAVASSADDYTDLINQRIERKLGVNNAEK